MAEIAKHVVQYCIANFATAAMSLIYEIRKSFSKGIESDHVRGAIVRSYLELRPSMSSLAQRRRVLGPGAPGAPGPTWAFNCHRGWPYTCADGCLHPVASSSSASPVYAGIPFFYAGVESLPYCLPSSSIWDSNWVGTAGVAVATDQDPTVHVGDHTKISRSISMYFPMMSTIS
jgi:hypothetical protein